MNGPHPARDGQDAVRVLIASSVYPPKIGGPASQAELFARELRHRGADVRVLTYGPRAETNDGVQVEYLDCSTARGVLTSLRRSLLVARQVNRLFKTFRPHVVQMQTPTGVLPLTVGILARLYRTPSWVKFAADPVLQLLHERTSSETGRRSVGWKLRLRLAALKLLAKLVFRTYRFAWATSPVVAYELRHRWGVPDERIVTAPNLVDLKHLRPGDAGKAPDEGFRLLMVTRLQKQKGIDVAIRALAELKDPRFFLRVVGEGDERHREDLRRLAERLGVADRIEWPGKVAREHLAKEYTNASLLLVPSRYEPFGIVLIEAMASGLPIVAANVGGIPYVADAGEYARLVHPDDAAELARAVEDLAASPDELRRLRQLGLSRAREFDAEAGVGKWLDIYRDIAQRRLRSAATDAARRNFEDNARVPQMLSFMSRLAELVRAHQRAWRAEGNGGLGPACPYFFSLCSAIAKGGSLRIVIVGANDGRINDPIYSFAQTFRDSTELFVVEPQKSLLPYLRQNYAFHPKTTVINSAVGPPGSITLYSVKESVWPRLRVPYAKDWPAYRAPTGVTSGIRDHVRRWLQKYGPKGMNPDSMIAEQIVECGQLAETLKRREAVDTVDVLQVDTEGMDDVVIYNSGIDELQPCIIYFEAENLSKDRLTDITDFLEQRGYALGRCGRDILAVRSVPPVKNQSEGIA